MNRGHQTLAVFFLILSEFSSVATSCRQIFSISSDLRGDMTVGLGPGSRGPGNDILQVCDLYLHDDRD